MSETVTAYLGLGSNLGDRLAAIRSAIDALAARPGIAVERVSSIIESEPMTGPSDSNDSDNQATNAAGGRYLNAVVRVGTTRTPRDLLIECLAIEAEHGRRRPLDRRWAPRTLDIDLLLYGDAMVDEPGLRIPHPRMHERFFVLGPLAEIAPRLRLPGRDRPVEWLLRRLRAEWSESTD